MTLNNFTDGENQKTIVVLSCSAEFTAEVQGELIFLSIVNIFLSITAVLGNTLILVALHKETLLHPPFKLLAVTDFCVGTISEPLNAVCWISAVIGKMRYLLSGSFGGYFGRLYLLWRVFINTDCNKCGQTSRLTTRAQIQISCNCGKDIHSYHCLLDCFCCWRTSFYSYMRVWSLHRLAITIIAYDADGRKFLSNQIHRIPPPYKEKAKQFKWT